MTKSRKPDQAEARVASAVKREQRIAYHRMNCQPDLGAQACLLAMYMGHSNALQRQGDLLHAWGATIAVNFTALEIAATPVHSPSEREWKLGIMSTIAPDLDHACQGHVARLIEAAAVYEAAVKPAVAGKHKRRGSKPKAAGTSVSDDERDISQEDLEQYAVNAASLTFVQGMLPAVDMICRDIGSLRSEGRHEAASGARKLLGRVLLSLCCVLSSSKEEAKQKIEVLELTGGIFRTDAPLMATIFDAACEFEHRKWPDA